MTQRTCYQPKPLRSRILTGLLTLFLLLSTVFPAFAAGDSLWEKETAEWIAKGVLYRQMERLTPSGWLKIHVLQADLTEPTLKVDTVTGSTLTTANTLTSMAKAQGAVAAINGDFFTPGKAPVPIGAVVKDGQLLTNPTYVEGMATFALRDDNTPVISYWSYSGEVTAPNGMSLPLGSINKPNDGMKLCLYNRFWGAKSPKDTLKIPDLVEMVVQNDRVVEIRVGQPSVDIPADGYILAGRRAIGDFLIQNFRPGDYVDLRYQVNPDWSRFKMAMGAGAVLVDKGRVPAYFKHNIAGVHPRTALGFSQDNKTLYLVVVDGRSADSKGMTQQELGQFMAELGAYSAVNLDGGGSSEMVGRPLGTSTLSVLNRPSDGIERRIPICIGLFSTAPATELAGLKIESASSLIPLNGGRTFTLKGYDANFNPVTVDMSQVRWSATPGSGTFTGSRFVGQKPGPALITAQIGTVTAALPVRVLDKTVRLETAQTKVSLTPGQKVNFWATAVDAQGYKAPLEPADVKISLIGNLGTLQGPTLTAGTTAVSGAAELQALGAKQRVLVRVSKPYQTIESFEALGNLSFLAWPTEVTGSVALTQDPALIHNGKSALQLTYDFSKTTAIRAAYLNFGPQGLVFPAGTSAFGIWVKGDGGNGHWLRARLLDGANKEYVLDLAQHVNWTGWKFLSAEIPAGLKGPVKLSRIYLAETDSTELNAGSIILDDLAIHTDLNYREDLKLITAVSDPARQLGKKTAGSYQFAVFGDMGLATNYDPAKAAFVNRVTNSVNNSTADFMVFAGSFSNEPANTAALKAKWLPLKKPFYSAEGTLPMSFNQKDAHFIYLDNTKGGLRAANPAQWKWLQADLAANKAKNVFIVLPKPMSAFTDTKEAELFRNTLKTYRENTGSNVWVFSSGQSTFSWELRDGVRYLGTPGTNLTKAAGTELPHYLLVTVKNGVPTYQMMSFK